MTPSKAMRGGEGREQWRMDRMWMMREEDAAGRTSEAGTLVPVCWRDIGGRDRPTTRGRKGHAHKAGRGHGGEDARAGATARAGGRGAPPPRAEEWRSLGTTGAVKDGEQPETHQSGRNRSAAPREEKGA